MNELTRLGGVRYSDPMSFSGKNPSNQDQTFSKTYQLALDTISPTQEKAPAKWLIAVSDIPSNKTEISKHIPLRGQEKKDNEGVHELALGLRGYRQQLLASNIANSDTPGYKAVDINIQEILRSPQMMAQEEVGVKLWTTADGHILTQTATRYAGIPLKYHVPQQRSIDGNTVEVDMEIAKMSENKIMYQFSADRVGGDYKGMLELFRSLK